MFDRTSPGLTRFQKVNFWGSQPFILWFQPTHAVGNWFDPRSNSFGGVGREVSKVPTLVWPSFKPASQANKVAGI